uniref:N-acetylmuramoyl-L-alanine amidase n=1 Tax=Chelativorans sp. YIM 93263 TaxID=2906648 RepID=UPI0023797088|nr:N-acetylmuramoyl-L-alanine amidase [Chelativorans sp. YIM 93263]
MTAERSSRCNTPILRLISTTLFLLLGIMVQPGVPSAAEEEPLLARNYKMAGDAVRTRVVLHFNREPDIDWFLLRSPHRLVIDLPTTEFAIDEAELEPRGLISKVRYGRMDEQRSRMILAVDGPFTLDDLKVLENESDPGYRLIVDILADSEMAFEAAMRERIADAPQSAAKAEDAVSPFALDEDRFTIILDPGHGGIDSGARGVNGTLEKTITLVFALELREKLESADYNVVLTRESDVFLRLDERVRTARQHEADLLISIHADSIRLRNFRGATVYTLSERASDQRAAAAAERENLSDSLAGFVVEDDAGEVADILLDLTRRETNAFSMRFARTLVGELDDTIHLVNQPLRSASFRVLRAPDVPSVLLELGYLSNPEDEEQLRDAKWRARAIDNVAEAIAAFVTARAGG